MRLPAEAACRLAVFALAGATLAGCALIPGHTAPTLTAAPEHAALETIGPAADYPMVLGEPFTVDGQLYTPADTLNYDAVGYAALDAGSGVTAAHRTLPLPSYVEVTSLDSGKTILVRVERRGPMTGNQLIALSPAAVAQLGTVAGAPVRVRRVNPPEAERAELRAGRAAPPRMDTPKTLVEVLRRKLPSAGEASLRAVADATPAPSASGSDPKPTSKPQPAAKADVRVAAAAGSPPVPSYPLQPLTDAPASKPAAVGDQSQPAHGVALQPRAEPARIGATSAAGRYVVQAGTFSVRANAEKVAGAIGGVISTAGKMYRVRTGPFAERKDAEAALAKVRAAGYSDARVYNAG